MLHPALAQALVTAHLEDMERAAARRHAIRLVSIGRRAKGRGAGLPVSASGPGVTSEVTPVRKDLRSDQ